MVYTYITNKIKSLVAAKKVAKKAASLTYPVAVDTSTDKPAKVKKVSTKKTTKVEEVVAAPVKVKAPKKVAVKKDSSVVKVVKTAKAKKSV